MYIHVICVVNESLLLSSWDAKRVFVQENVNIPHACSSRSVRALRLFQVQLPYHHRTLAICSIAYQIANVSTVVRQQVGKTHLCNKFMAIRLFNKIVLSSAGLTKRMHIQIAVVYGNGHNMSIFECKIIIITHRTQQPVQMCQILSVPSDRQALLFLILLLHILRIQYTQILSCVYSKSIQVSKESGARALLPSQRAGQLLDHWMYIARAYGYIRQVTVETASLVHGSITCSAGDKTDFDWLLRQLLLPAPCNGSIRQLHQQFSFCTLSNSHTVNLVAVSLLVWVQKCVQ